MESNLNIKEILSFYLEAGIDETIGDTAGFVLPEKEEPKARPAITNMAQSTQNASKNAKEACLAAPDLESLRQKMEAFEGCALKLNAKSTVFGAGNPNARLMIIGEAPGADEDRQGLPFVGRSGHLLEKMLNAIGLKREEVYITNILPWRPPGNRTPTDAEVAVCLPFLKRQIDLIKPDILLLLGGSAANALLDNADSISRLRGHFLKYKTSEGAEIDALATFHPAYLLRNAAQKSKAWADFLRIAKNLNGN